MKPILLRASTAFLMFSSLSLATAFRAWAEGDEMSAADTELNKTYKETLSLMSSAKEKDELHVAQRAWIAFRDAEIALYKTVYDASGTTLKVFQTGLTEKRTEQLKTICYGAFALNGRWEPAEHGGVTTLPNGEKFISGGSVESGEDTLTFPNGQKFVSETAKGGPHFPFVSKDGTLVAIVRSPSTKSGVLHIYIKEANGQFKEIEDVNKKVARLLKDEKGGWDAAAENVLRLRSMYGHTLTLWAVAYKGADYTKYQFEVIVSPDGSLTRAVN